MTATMPLLPAGLKIYLINLDRAEGRRAAMERKLSEAGLAAERVPAVDGAALALPSPDFDEAGQMLLHGRRAIPAEIGCYLSHVDCARRLLESDASHALILEDDVSFPPDFAQILAAALADPSDWDILRLSTVNRGRKFAFRPLAPGRALAVCLTREKGAGAYVVNRRAAAWIAESLMPMRMAYDIAFDLEYLWGLHAAFVTPVPVNQKSAHPTQIQSTVGAGKLPLWRYLTVLPVRAFLETSRVILRGLRFLALRLRHRRRRPPVSPAAALRSL